MVAELLQFKNTPRHNEKQNVHNKMDLGLFLKVSQEGDLIYSYMQAFPVFGRMVRLLSSHIGFELNVDGRSYLGTAIKQAVNKVAEQTSIESMENWQASDALVKNLVVEIANLHNWLISVEMPHDLIEVWNMTTHSFESWMKVHKRQEFNVTKKAFPPPRLEIKGLAIRFLCFGVEDETVARIVEDL